MGRIVRNDYEAVGEMYAVGLNIPDRGRFALEKLDPIPPSQADQARGRQRFHVEMHWTVEAEKLDTTFFADFAVDRAAIIVQEAGIREKTDATPPSADSSQDRPSPEKGVMEGTVLDVLPDGMINISLGSDDGLKVGDTLHVRRQAPDGSSRSLAIIVVKTTERASATCAVLHELADPPPHLPLEKGDIAARWCPVGKVLSVEGDVVEISLGKDARLTRGERIFVHRDSTAGTKEWVTELTVGKIGDKSATCKVRPGLVKGERWPVRAGDWAIPHRTEFFNLDYRGVEEKGADGAVRGNQRVSDLADPRV